MLTFIGLTYLIVYVGAVSILFLFILMLIDVRISELKDKTNNSLPLAIIIIIYLNYILFQLLPTNWYRKPYILWAKLSNPGEVLKLMVSSLSLKGLSG